MSTKILITGGTGLVGMTLSQHLSDKGFEVVHLSRTENLTKQFPAYRWDIQQGFIDERAIDVDYIIHLAGESVAGGRWTSERKKRIYDSRIDSTRLLVDKVREHNIQLKGFISASAIGLYGTDTGAKWVDEETQAAEDFLAQVVRDWEQASVDLKEVPKAYLRIGIVLSDKEGALPKLVQPIKFGVGAPLGLGKQYMSWIHIDDLASMFVYILEHRLTGAYNAVASNPATNAAFTKAVAKQIKRPLFLPNVPAFVMKLMLGEMSSVVLGGNRVSNKKIKNEGFKFQYDELTPALKNLLS